jgi:hypothetical protein
MNNKNNSLMNLQLNEFEMLIVKTSLEDRLARVNQRLVRIKAGLNECRGILQEMESDYWKERAQEFEHKRDIIMEEVYQLENIIHEVNKARLK